MTAQIAPIQNLSRDVMVRTIALSTWLVGEARMLDDPDAVADGLAQRLTDIGVPVDRMSNAMPTLYAVRRGLGRTWTRETGVRSLDFPWGNQHVYEASPYYRAHQTRDWVTFRLDQIGDDAFGVVADLRAEGYTDYICIPVFFQDGAEGGVTFATRHPDGFGPTDRAVLRAIEPSLAILFDLNRSWQIINDPLRMYVGDEPHARILSGQVRRGDVVSMKSAIVFTDMRGYTALSSRLSAEGTVALLNRYFDCVVPPIEERGGHVLKYIGDGVLAIFRADEEPTAACSAAFGAARDIVRLVNEDRAVAPDDGRFDIKVALHVGEVAYGNIGSGARLDYTVVGGAVNLASRVADLGGELGHHVMVSADFAALLPSQSFADLGDFALRGIVEPQRVLVPA